LEFSRTRTHYLVFKEQSFSRERRFGMGLWPIS